MKESTILVWKVVGLFISGYALLVSIVNMIVYEKIRAAGGSYSSKCTQKDKTKQGFSPCSSQEAITKETARNLFILNLTIAILSLGAFILLIYLIVKKPEQKTNLPQQKALI